jgi:predicted dehydrogenase
MTNEGHWRIGHHCSLGLQKMAVNRRRFLKSVAATGALAALGGRALHAAPQETPPRRGRLIDERRMAVGSFGVGGRGETNTILMVGQEMKALCDVDDNYLTSMLVRYPKTKPYFDWREVLDKVSLEAVVISTPDHQHAPIALAAMKKGLHAYIEKPLAHTIAEVRQIEALAKEKNLAVWMGNQHHVSAGYRRAIELIQSNTVGIIKEVHVWTNRPSWLQGKDVKLPLMEETPPDTLKWDLWLGPAAERPYNHLYHPVTWRGWWDFGGGPLADMGPHLLDPIFTALQLNSPVTITPETSDDGNDQVGPTWSTIRFQFPARGELPELALTWYDGGKKPPAELAGRMRLPMNGAICVGELGKLFIPDLGRVPTIIPNNRGETLDGPEPVMVLTRGHQQDWLDACRDSAPRHDQLAEACRLTELCLAGNIAIRLKKPLKWDPAKGQFDLPEANQMLGGSYRKGWELPS